MAPKHGKTSPQKVAGPSEHFRFAVGQSFLGSIIVASSENGVVAILIGEDPDQLIEDLQKRFPRTRLVRGNRDDDRLLKRVVDFVEDPAHGLDVPLDIRGTAFQQRVYQVVRKIPPGQTTTYTEVARKIGAPKAMRAVGNACSTNILSVAIPCHRVLHNDGSLRGGDAWGMDRARILLDREAAAKPENRPTPPSRRTKK